MVDWWVVGWGGVSMINTIIINVMNKWGKEFGWENDEKSLLTHTIPHLSPLTHTDTPNTQTHTYWLTI